MNQSRGIIAVTEYLDAEGNRHREDGPAVIYSDGTKEYWLRGVPVDLWEDMGPEAQYEYLEENV